MKLLCLTTKDWQRSRKELAKIQEVAAAGACAAINRERAISSQPRFSKEIKRSR